MPAEKTEKSIACVIYPGVSMLELTCAYSFLKGLEMAKYRLHLVAERLDVLPSDTPLSVVPQKSFAELPNPAILAVMGCGPAGLAALDDAVLRSYLVTAAERAEYVIGCGAGSLLLAASGLLQGRRAATHWAYQGLLASLGSQYAPERWVEDGRFITTAGGTASMDMGLQLVARLAGERNARMLQLFAEYDPQPPSGAIDVHKLAVNPPSAFSAAELQALESALAGSPELLQAVQVNN